MISLTSKENISTPTYGCFEQRKLERRTSLHEYGVMNDGIRGHCNNDL